MASIKLNNITLDFPIYGANTRSLKKQLVHFSTGGMIKRKNNTISTVRALDNISLQFNPGEVIGLIGHNGAGKSTLLRVLSGIYEPTMGEMDVDGKVSALLDISLGTHIELTGYENIVLNGILRGLTRKEIARRSNAIAEFSDLGNYLSMPLRTYSDGMRLRLAFSLATNSVHEILVLDEVVGVGDGAFLEKAKNRIATLVKQSEIVVFASHTVELIKRFCNKILWLEAGKVVAFGDVDECLERYKNKYENRSST